MSDRTVAVRLRAEVGSYIAGMKQAAAATKDLTRHTLDTAAKHKQAYTQAGLAVGAFGAAAAAGVGLAVSRFADFDAAMSNVQAATHASASSMDDLRAAALEAGARTVFSATEAADAIEQLAKAGVSSADVLGGGLNGALDLAAAGSLAVGDAAEIAATAMTQFGLSGRSVPHLADLLAAGAGKAQGEVTDLAMALKQSGLVASQMGLSVEETTGTLAAFASAGLLGSDAGTSFRTMLLRLTNPTDEAADLLKKLGINVYDAQGQFVGMQDLAGQLSVGMGKLAPATRNAALATIFGSDAIRAANVLYGQGAQGLADWTKKVDDAGYAQETAGIKLDNLKGDVEAFSGSIETAFIKTGSAGNGMARGVVQAATSVVNAYSELPGAAQTATLGLGGVLAVTSTASAGFLLLAPRIAETRDALKTLSTEAPKATAAMSALGKASAIGAVIVGTAVAIDALQRAATDAPPRIGAVTDGLVDFLTTGKATGDVARLLGEDFSGLAAKIELANKTRYVSLDDFGMGGGSKILKARQDLEALDEALTALTNGGHAGQAAQAFAVMTRNAEANGISVEELRKKFPGYTDAVKAAAAQTKLNADAQAGGVKAAGNLGVAQLTLKGRIKAATDALKAQADQLRASYDPVFAMQKAVQGQKDAQTALGEAIKKHGRKSREAKDAQWALFESTVDLQGAALGLREAVVKGTVTFDQSRAQLDRWVEQGLLTRGQADSMEQGIRNVVGAANDLTKTPAKAKVEGKGIDKVIIDLKAVQDYLKGINGTVSTATVVVNRVNTASGAADKLDRVTRAQGGWVSGPGTGTSDSIPAALSNGEFVVNARSAQQNALLLEAINSGRRFAAGGWVTGRPSGVGMDQSTARELIQAVREARPVNLTATVRDLDPQEFLDEAVFASRVGRL